MNTEIDSKKEIDWQKNFFLISLTCFVFSAIELFVLNPMDYSYAGYYNERLCVILCCVFGFLSGNKRFIVVFFSLLGLSMLPMMIPFIMIFSWISGGDKTYSVSEKVRAQEYHYFGQVPGDLVLYENTFLLFERKKHQFNVSICEINALSQINTVTYSEEKITVEFKNGPNIFLKNENPTPVKENCSCEINLKENFIKTNLDSSSTKLLKDGYKLKAEWQINWPH